MRALWWVLLIPKMIGLVLFVGGVTGVLGIKLHSVLCRMSKRIFKKNFDRYIGGVLVFLWIASIVATVVICVKQLAPLSDEFAKIEPWAAVLIAVVIIFMYLFIWSIWTSARSDKQGTDSKKEEKEIKCSDTTGD